MTTKNEPAAGAGADSDPAGLSCRDPLSLLDRALELAKADPAMRERLRAGLAESAPQAAGPSAPRWEFWTQLHEASPLQCVLLSLDIDPDQIEDQGPPRHYRRDLQPIAQQLKAQQEVSDRLRILRNHTGYNDDGKPLQGKHWIDGQPQPLELANFVRWALSKHWDMPEPLCTLANQVSNPPTNEAPAEPWPWGTYETALLGALAKAAEHWWKKYDPDDPTTGPTNEQVIEWLLEKVPNPPMSRNIAAAIATILRAPDVPNHRR